MSSVKREKKGPIVKTSNGGSRLLEKKMKRREGNAVANEIGALPLSKNVKARRRNPWTTDD